MPGQGQGEVDGEFIVFVHPLLLDFQGGAMWRVGAMSKKAGKNSDMPPLPMSQIFVYTSPL